MTAANWLTAARIFMSPLFVLAFVQEGLWARITALLIIIISELTDAFDGALARSRGEVTDFGKLLDPMADSISRITVFVAFMWSGLIPWWMLLVFIYRDSAVATMRTVCAFRGEVVAARRSGKIKAIVQATAIITILVARIANSLFPQYLNESFVLQLAWWLMLVTTLYTAFSLYEYLNANRHIWLKAAQVRGEQR